MRRILALFAVAGLVLAASPPSGAEVPGGASLTSVGRAATSEPAVTVYGASWCSACRSLERGLRSRSIPFDLIDVDDNPKAYEVARRATGKNVVPLTSVARDRDDVTWIVGADVDAVEKAYRGE